MGLNFNEKGGLGFGKFNYEKARETAETAPNLSLITTKKR